MTRIVVATVTLGLLLPLSRSLAQTTGELTLKAPLNLTQVSRDIGKVQVSCTISSGAFRDEVGATRDYTNTGSVGKAVELPVSGGQLVTTASVVIALSFENNPVGIAADYECKLLGFSTTLQRWEVFDAAHAVPAFRLSPTPQPLKGSFVW